MLAPFNAKITPPTGPWASFPGGIGAPGLGTIPRSGGGRKRKTHRRKSHKRSTRRHRK
jgi:hypothetical protein